MLKPWKRLELVCVLMFTFTALARGGEMSCGHHESHYITQHHYPPEVSVVLLEPVHVTELWLLWWGDDLG